MTVLPLGMLINSKPNRRKGIWKRIKQKLRSADYKQTTSEEDHVLLIEDNNKRQSNKDKKGKEKVHTNKDNKKKSKSKAILKSIGHSVVTACRYMGVGAAMANPSTFASAYTIPANDPFHYPNFNSVTAEHLQLYNCYYY